MARLKCRGCHRPFIENDRARVVRSEVYHERCVIAGIPLRIEDTVPDGTAIFVDPDTGETVGVITNIATEGK